MNFLLSFLFVFSIGFLKSQNVDSLANIPSQLKENEIRIYKDTGNTDVGHIFRIYKENKIWKAELVRWFLPYKISKGEFKTVSPIVKILNSKKSLEEVFVNFQLRNINYLPAEESFKYKKTNAKLVVFDKDEKAFVIQQKLLEISDGTGYLVKYQFGKEHNEFSYNNPESYLEEYPDIDELNDFVDILKYIRKEFNIEF